MIIVQFILIMLPLMIMNILLLVLSIGVVQLCDKFLAPVQQSRVQENSHAPQQLCQMAGARGYLDEHGPRQSSWHVCVHEVMQSSTSSSVDD